MISMISIQILANSHTHKQSFTRETKMKHCEHYTNTQSVQNKYFPKNTHTHSRFFLMDFYICNEKQ